MRRFKSRLFLFSLGFALTMTLSVSLLARPSSVTFSQAKNQEEIVFALKNDVIECSVSVISGRLVSDALKALPGLSNREGNPLTLVTDADFKLELMWTAWQAPGQSNNADNLVTLSKEQFRFKEHLVNDLSGGGKELALIFEERSSPLEVRLVYRLEPGEFYARRKLGIRQGDKPQEGFFPSGPHFLRWIWPRFGSLALPGSFSLLKPGGFGQPIAFLLDQGGGFFGLEYPTSENHLFLSLESGAELRCGQEWGEKIASSWLESEWVVEALTPDPHVKLWFWKYIDKLRAAPLRPYLLYNTWYDLRSPENPRFKERTLDERNCLKAVDLFRKKLFEERGLKLDAFVLDDGWDELRSDWVLGAKQFPRGLSPITEALKSMGTKLGLWLGPIGGYANHDVRVNWMKDRGYEVVGDQMCIAGERYHALLKKRVIDFMRNNGVAYYKWDGIQFSCSEPGHGHLPDIYSRRAAMEAVIELCRAVRKQDPDVFLNITSGTWLSPWWVKYADTIWMQGQDYGFADVPSISRRDQSTTYRDSVLFDDLKRRDFWFPPSQLMTHGVIRALISPFADPKEPLDKFVDEVVLYAARGIAMWELYISPDLLSDEEWNAEAQAIRWAREKFDVLSHTEMIGGDPASHSPYGYAHFLGKRGIVALRNPVVDPQIIRLSLSPALGLEARAENLVVECIYPHRRISPRLFRAEDNLEIPLQGFEMAIYEVYPLAEAAEPLLADVTFEARPGPGKNYALEIIEAGKNVRLLNPDKVKGASLNGNPLDPLKIVLPASDESRVKPVSDFSFGALSESSQAMEVKLRLQEPATEAWIAVLATPDSSSKGKNIPSLEVYLDGRKADIKVEEEKGSWSWQSCPLTLGECQVRFQWHLKPEEKSWQGTASCWLIYNEKPVPMRITLLLNHPLGISRVFPPQPFPAGMTRKSVKIGGGELRISP
jgi:hypothetical protein